MRTPTLAGPWLRLVTDDAHHFNDFCLFVDRAGVWHATGIMGTGTWASEQSLFHASGPALDEPMTLHAPLLAANPHGEAAPQKHAPYVVERGGVYHMFYRRPPGTIMHTTTRDPYDWPDLGVEAFTCRDARDVWIVTINNLHHMYYCQWLPVDGLDRSTIQLRTSPDLERWSDAVTVHVDTRRPADHSYLESPVVIAEDDGYYLFVRHRLFEENQLTVMYHADRPDAFPSGDEQWFATLPQVHAPEVVRWRDAWWIARVSGAPEHITGAPQRGGWVDVAELTFA